MVGTVSPGSGNYSLAGSRPIFFCFFFSLQCLDIFNEVINNNIISRLFLT